VALWLEGREEEFSVGSRAGDRVAGRLPDPR
jgi:hypothetical protein